MNEPQLVGQALQVARIFRVRDRDGFLWTISRAQAQTS